MRTGQARRRRRTLAAFLAAAVGCAVLTACGSSTTTGSAHTTTAVAHPVVRVSTPAVASAATNKAQALTETKRLIRLSSVPPGATRVSVAPKALSGPAMGAPMSDSLVDTSRFWRVPMSLAQSKPWIAAHPPGGLTATGSSQSTTGSVVTGLGYGYTDHRRSAAWQNAALDVGIAPDGARASYWRADGIALWLDPTPATVAAGGRRLRVTVAGGCPSSDRGVVNVPPGPISTLLPAGRPTAGLICAYRGLNGAAFTLRARAPLNPTQAQRLARQATAIDLSHTKGGSTSCPDDDGTATVIAFTYPGGANATLWLNDTGCPAVSNGTIAAGDASISKFATAVAALLPH